MTTKTTIALVQKKIGIDDDGIAGPITWDALFEFITHSPSAGLEDNELITVIQQKVGVDDDGVAGEKTWKAIFKFVFKEEGGNIRRNIGSSVEKLDNRSEKCISSLDGEVQMLARALVGKAKDANIAIKVISGFRSFQEQNALFAQGRTKPGPIVTNARAGFSNHNFGLAFDIGVYEQNIYQGESPKYKKVGAIGKSLQLSWGGDWKSIVDMPHFELRPNWAKSLSEREMLAELRLRKQQGISFF
ncbi:MAG: peptidase m15b and m15c dd-carboxypeptidase vany/endolysin [Segetibacter sp.]|nr:peptidase m15b and m15c dd-carboxypeptidase vany/endolysin [Segetibacter sp.]